MKLKYKDEKGKEKSLNVSFWSMYKFYILGALLTMGFGLVFGFIMGIFIAIFELMVYGL